MSGRLYDLDNAAKCKLCGSEMRTSSDNNFNGPSCKNKKCKGGILEAEYYHDPKKEDYGWLKHFKELEQKILDKQK